MQQMMDAFPGVPVGLSDHTLSNHACFGAVAMGASILERHFTDHHYRTGPDISCSMDEVACKELIAGANLLAQMRGGVKEPAKEEQVTIDFAFATVVTTKAIKAGEIFSEDNIWVKRPGTGQILAEEYNTIIGKRAVVDINNDEHLQYEWISQS